MPLEDIAAALATQARAGDEFLMTEPPVEKRRNRRDRDRNDRGDRFDRDRDDRRGGYNRGDRGGRGRFDRGSQDMETYRLAVGKRQHVRPGAIVGALANEGGLSNKDFGRITIGSDFTLVELPKGLPKSVFDNLRDTRISGQLIHIEKDTGGRGRGGYNRGDRGDRGDRDWDDRGDRGGRGGYNRDRGNGGRNRDRGDWNDRRGGYNRGDRGDRDRGGYNRDRGDRDWRD